MTTTTVSYRPYQPEDAEAVKSIIDEAFHIHRYARAPRLHTAAIDAYLREVLLESTYARVAEKDGRVIGILTGRVEGRPRLPGRLSNRLRAAGDMLCLLLTGFPERRTLRYYSQFERIYERLHASVREPLSNEVTVFAVDASARGLGVGSALFRDYMAHLRAHDRTGFYLYTDSLCTYQFYERKGMVRAAEEDMALRVEGLPGAVEVYLYTGRVPEQALSRLSSSAAG